MVKVSGSEASAAERLVRGDQHAHLAALIRPDLDHRIAAAARFAADHRNVGFGKARYFQDKTLRLESLVEDADRIGVA